MGSIKHVDLWNQNVEFIEQEAAWERPAVFVEFGTIDWSRTKASAMDTQAELRLHVVTDWHGSAASDSETRAESLAVFELLDEIRVAIEGLTGETFDRMQLRSSLTNHNHEELLESIEVFGYRGLVCF